MTLAQYCESSARNYGLVHKVNIEALRNYLKTADSTQLNKELLELKDRNHILQLQEAGVPKFMWDNYQKMIGKLLKFKAESDK